MQQVLFAIICGLVDNEEAIQITVERPSDTEIVFHIQVAEEDKGRVIGRKGAKAQAIRTIMSAIASKEGLRSRVDID